MPEKYGVYAQLVPSVAGTPIDTSTNIVFIGAARIENVEGWEKMDLINRPIYISSYADDEKKLGGGAASVPVSPLSAKLSGKGLMGYEARWAQEVTDPSGAIRVVRGVCYIPGYVTQVPASAVNPGAEGTADYNVSVVKYRLVVDGNELHNIDRGNGVLIIDGVDYQSEVDKLP